MEPFIFAQITSIFLCLAFPVYYRANFLVPAHGQTQANRLVCRASTRSHGLDDPSDTTRVRF